MPLITETPMKAYAHCRNPRCTGYQQQEVDALRVEHSFRGVDLGDDSGHPYSQVVERSTVSYRFAGEDAEEASKCPGCGKGREVTGDPRPMYQNISGYDPNYLVGAEVGFDPNMKNSEADQRIAELEAKVNALLAALSGDEAE